MADKVWKFIKENLRYDVLDILPETFVLDRDDLIHEANSNLCCLYFTSSQIQQISARDIIEFLELVIANRRNILLFKSIKNVLFYLWHDVQAGYLCFSFTSESKPPFGCELNQVSMEEVIRSYIEEPGGVFRLEEFECVPQDNINVEEEEKYIQNIYMRII